MSFLIKSLRLKQILDIHRAVSAVQARQGHFYPEFKPGPVPKTEEERIKAAKKYNLLPEEYESYEEGEGYGDYPKLPLESIDSKDPWYLWDNEELRKNFNEPVHIRAMNLLPEALSTGEEPGPSVYKQALYFVLICSVTGGFLLTLEQVHFVHPVTEQQFITPGVTHYTFETQDKGH